MKISVVIPTYNCARYLPQAIDSVLNQTQPAAEILVVDDGSTDNTEEIIATGYAGSVRYLKQSNAGPSAARNHGIREAKGEIIGFLDADDIWLPKILSRVSETFRYHPDVGLVTADKEVIDPQGATTGGSWWARHGAAEQLREFDGRPLEGAFLKLLQTNFINTSLAFVRRDVLEKTGPFDEAIRFGEDWDLWLRIAARSSVMCLTEILGQYRLHDANVTRATETMLADLVRVNRKIATWAGPELKELKVPPNKLIADALCNLGYWYFSRGRYKEAQARLKESLLLHPTKRAGKYAFYSYAVPFIPGRMLEKPSP